MHKAILIFGLIVALAAAHSWLDCADWKFNNPAVNPTQSGWLDREGTCAGWARRFPRNRREFGTHDSYIWFRHYLQAKPFSTANSNLAAPCNPFNTVGNDGVTKVGGDERRGNPIDTAYSPNRDPDGFEFGTRSRVKVGQQMCFRWPAKNHAGHVNDQNMVFVNWAPQAGADPTQLEFNQNTVAQLRYRNCQPGPASPSDQTGVGSDRAACGGCFTVPNRAPGIYSVQWRWMLNEGEWYTSCADVEVLADTTPVPSTSAPVTTGRQQAVTTGRQTVTTGAQTTGKITVKAYVTVVLPGAPDSFDVQAFIRNLANVLKISTNAISEVGVKLDKSTLLSTNVELILINNDGVDPVKAAQNLKKLAETKDAILAQNDLSGITVQLGDVEEVSAASSVIFSMVLSLLVVMFLF